MDFLFDLSALSASTPNRPCNYGKDLAEMLLPSSKNLWSAQTQNEWEKEYAAQSKMLGRNGDLRPTFGQLLQHDIEIHPNAYSLDRWLAQVDEFGTLVVAAASLAEATE